MRQEREEPEDRCPTVRTLVSYVRERCPEEEGVPLPTDVRFQACTGVRSIGGKDQQQDQGGLALADVRQSGDDCGTIGKMQSVLAPMGTCCKDQPAPSSRRCSLVHNRPVDSLRTAL